MRADSARPETALGAARSADLRYELRRRPDIAGSIVRMTGADARADWLAPEIALMKARSAAGERRAWAGWSVTDALGAALERVAGIRAAAGCDRSGRRCRRSIRCGCAPSELLDYAARAGSTPEFIHRGFAISAEQVRRYLAELPLENVVQKAPPRDARPLGTGVGKAGFQRSAAVCSD